MAKSFFYQDLVGTPFLWGGRGPAAFDCWGLVRECLLRQGLMPPEYASSEAGEVNALVLAVAAEQGPWTRLERAAPGCVVALRMRGAMVSHVGVMIDRVRFLHITEKTLACVERLSHPLWARRVAGFYELAVSPGRGRPGYIAE